MIAIYQEKKRQKAAAELAALEEKMVFMHLAEEVEVLDASVGGFFVF